MEIVSAIGGGVEEVSPSLSDPKIVGNEERRRSKRTPLGTLQHRSALNCVPDETMRIPLHLDCTTFCSLVVSYVETMRNFVLSVTT
ncbi:hypothetical protein J6590_013674 [Homalodisca vitripennis]|nr:hypothetical protein J6590_013674 [Homalodisca vitripennis]